MESTYIAYLVIVTLFFIGFTYWQSKQKIVFKKVSKQVVISSHTPAEGVGVDVLKEGVGPQVIDGKVVRVHYTAWLTNGKKVDSSYDKGEVFQFTIGRRQVIPGWEDGMRGMKEGEIRKFTIAPEKAYGSSGKANVPPNAIIIFQVELLKVI